MASLVARSAFLGAQAAASSSSLNVERGSARVTCRKEGIHPKVFKQSTVYCNGEMVMTTMGTKEEYVVDVWSGNHPFFQGNNSTLLTEAGRVDKFKQRFGNLGVMSTIPVLTKGEIVTEKKGGGAKGKGKGKK